jgi:hypothetical protein
MFLKNTVSRDATNHCMNQMSDIEVFLIRDEVTNLQNRVAQQRSLFRSSALQSDTAGFHLLGFWNFRKVDEISSDGEIIKSG